MMRLQWPACLVAIALLACSCADRFDVTDTFKDAHIRTRPDAATLEARTRAWNSMVTSNRVRIGMDQRRLLYHCGYPDEVVTGAERERWSYDLDRGRRVHCYLSGPTLVACTVEHTEPIVEGLIAINRPETP